MAVPYSGSPPGSCQGDPHQPGAVHLLSYQHRVMCQEVIFCSGRSPESLDLPPAVCPGEGDSLRRSVWDCGRAPWACTPHLSVFPSCPGPLFRKNRGFGPTAFASLSSLKFSESLHSFWIFKVEMEFTSCQSKTYSSLAPSAFTVLRSQYHLCLVPGYSHLLKRKPQVRQQPRPTTATHLLSVFGPACSRRVV